jgi:DNA-binding transcriptional regulator YhcF (GntR family)
MKVDPHSGVPVHRQMIATIVAAIESGELDTGDRLPSIRKLSAELDVNPNTTAKVYRELELRGFIESKAGSGSFVLPQGEKNAASEKKARMQKLLDKMLGEAKSLQISEQDLIELLRLRADT